MTIPYGQQMMPTQEPGPRAGRSDLPIDLSEIPTPAQAPINVSPAALQPSHADMPPGAGYMGTSGKIAALASNFLHGWLQGKAAKEAKMVRDATNEVQGAKGAFDLVQNSFNNLVQMGASDNPEWQKANPELAQKYATTKQAMMQSWQNYISSMEKYALPQAPDGGPVKKGVGGKIKEALLPQGPALYAQKSIEFLKSLDPTTLVTQSPDSLQKLSQVQTSQEHAKQAELQTKVMTLGTAEAQQAYNMRETFEAQTQEYNQLAAKSQRTPDEQKRLEVLDLDLRTLKGQLAARKMPVVTPMEIATGKGKEETERIALEMKNAAAKKLQAGESLSWNDLYVLGAEPKNELDVYMMNVGPDKRFATPLQAVQQMVKDNADAQSKLIGFRSKVIQEREMVRGALRQRLQREPSDEEIDTEYLNTVHRGAGAAGTKPLDPLKASQDASNVAKAIVTWGAANNHPEYVDYLTRTVKGPNGTEQTVYGLNPEAFQRKSGWLVKDDTDEQYVAKQEALKNIQSMMVNSLVSQGYTEEQARQIAGVVSEPPQVQPAEGKGAAKAAGAAQAAAQASQNQAGGFTYSIRTPDGKVKTMRVATREEVEKARAQAKQKGHIFTEVKNTNQ